MKKRIKCWIKVFTYYLNPYKFLISSKGKYQLSKWSKIVIKNWGSKCVRCSSTKKLEAHHILPKKLYPQKALNVNNGIVLCKNCHTKYHSMFKLEECNNSSLFSFIND